MYKITVNNKVLYAQKGTLLSKLLIDENVPHPCGGRGVCKKCTVLVNGKPELSCKYIINDDITVTLPENGEIVELTGNMDFLTPLKDPIYVLDIGTTTLALALVMSDGNATVKTATNPQCSLGADVLTRIDYCRKNGISQLQSMLIKKINELTGSFGISVRNMVVTGNTTMLHTFFGADCSYIGVAPYTPAFLNAKTEPAKSLGLERIETVKSLPSISSFVGADIVSGIYFAGVPSKGKCNLLVDLGTNAEVVLYSESFVLCTSASAGPCFEGVNISCGMSARKGAIYAYSPGAIKTIENGVPRGICGTGLIDVIAWLLQTGAIDKTGYFEEESLEIADGVFINQQDVRQYQLAKSAICSAILTLMNSKRVLPEDVEKMYISGGFSTEINIKNAVLTGLFPKELALKGVPINNSSLLGALKYVCHNGNLDEIVCKAEYISSTEDFSQLFIENMSF